MPQLFFSHCPSESIRKISSGLTKDRNRITSFRCVKSIIQNRIIFISSFHLFNLAFDYKFACLQEANLNEAKNCKTAVGEKQDIIIKKLLVHKLQEEMKELTKKINNHK